MPDSQHSSPENSPISTDFGAETATTPPTVAKADQALADSAPIETEPTPSANTEADAKPRPVARPLPSSPVERARLEAQGHLPQRNPLEERSTMVAFGLLFVLPVVIILFAMLLLLPFINSQLTQDPNPGGATMQTNPNSLPPTRQ